MKNFVLAICIAVTVVHGVHGQCGIQQLQITSFSSRQLTVTWICYDGGTLTQSFFEYQVNYQLTNIGQCQPVTEESVGDGFSRRVPLRLAGGTFVYEYSATLSELIPYSSYSISVMARRADSSMRISSVPVTTTTNQEAPSAAPANIQTTNTQRTQLTFTWDEVPCGSRHGSIIEYAYRLNPGASTGTEHILAAHLPRQMTLNGLSPGTMYTFNVAARNSIGTGTTGTLIAMTISEQLSSTCPQDVVISPISGQPSPLVAYTQPTITGGTPPYKDVVCNPPSGNIFGVGTHTVTCTVSDAAGNITTCTFLVRVNAVTDLKQPDTPILRTEGSAVIIEFDELPLHVSNVYVSVELVGGTARNRRQALDFIVANLTRNDIAESMLFTIGDNKTYGGYLNQPLVDGQTYIVRVAHASCSQEECAVEWSSLTIVQAPKTSTESTAGGGVGANIGAIVGGGVGAIVIVIVVVVIIICCRRRKPENQKAKVPTINESPENETYAEIDRNQSETDHDDAKPKSTGYEVNIAMAGMRSAGQVPR